MELNRKERFMIVNQLKILEALYPQDASSYAIQRTAFEEGYESHYEWGMEFISKETLSKDLTREVIDTLDMYRAFHFYKRDGKDTSGLKTYSMKFSGYDGNDELESRLMGYARYFVVELDRFKEVIEENGEFFDFNSHMPMRENYKKMLEKWLSIEPGTNEGQRHNLRKDQLASIVGEE